MIKENTPSIKDIAKRAGTSVGTVSNVLNGRGNVSKTLSERVMRAINETGYKTNPIARNLKRGKTDFIALVISDINCIFFPPMIKGIESVLSTSGYTLSVFDTRREITQERRAISSVYSKWMDGMLLDSLDSTEALIQTLSGKNHQKTIVSLERDLTCAGIDSVFIDNRSASMVATRHLIELGCRRIAHISCGNSNPTLAQERMQGYQDALIQAGIPFDSSLVCIGDFSPNSGYEAISGLIRSGLSFDAVFSSNDQMAIGALYALSNAGIRVPEDIRVVGFDNVFASSLVTPSLTTISVSSYEMGVHAAKLLLNRLSGDDSPPCAVKLNYELIIRNSTVASAYTKWNMACW